MAIKETINQHLQHKIERECMVKKASKNAQLSYEKRRSAARSKIADLKQSKQLEDEYLLNYEV